MIGNILALSQLVPSENYLRVTFTSREHAIKVFENTVKAEVKHTQKQTADRHARQVKIARKTGSAPPKPLHQGAWDASKLLPSDYPDQLKTEGLPYYAWAYAPAHSIFLVMNELLHPVAAVDGTHSTRVVQHTRRVSSGSGVYLLAYAQDANKNQVLLLAVHVLGNESNATWAYFYSHLRKAYTNAQGVCMIAPFTIIGDGMKVSAHEHNHILLVAPL